MKVHFISSQNFYFNFNVIDDNMDYIGYSIYQRTFIGNHSDFNSLGVQGEEPIEVLPQFLDIVESWADACSEMSSTPLGTTIHFCDIARNMLDEFIIEPWLETVKQRTFRYPFVPGFHIAFRNEELPLAPGFPETFKYTMDVCKKLKVDACVLHAPMIETNDTTNDWIDLMLRDDIIEAMRENNTILCWENAQDTPARYRLLKNLLEWRECLVERLDRTGNTDLASRHLFCFDTGHFILSMQRDGASQDEVDQYLPEFGKLVKVFHIQTNDGTRDHHLLPFVPYSSISSVKTKQDVDPVRFEQNSALALQYLKVCDAVAEIEGRHVHLEIDAPHTIDDVVAFYRRYFQG
ncbi:MAG TPA: hypothetical protein VKM55_21880 [Candidatus Lokiarchaeia archaeon]|nr:hypothetical protein [Candidatus Lokiarchaeia archaeon]